jgi:hypothetical protein
MADGAQRYRMILQGISNALRVARPLSQAYSMLSGKYAKAQSNYLRLGNEF